MINNIQNIVQVEPHITGYLPSPPLLSEDLANSTPKQRCCS